MTRRRLSTRERQTLWDCECAKTGSFPQCNLCLLPVRPGQAWEESHFPIPYALGGKEIAIAHKRCNHQHGAKIVTPMVAKTKRVRIRHIGAYRSSRPLPCGRDSRLSKKISGEIVPRLTLAEKLEAMRAKRMI